MHFYWLIGKSSQVLGSIFILTQLLNTPIKSIKLFVKTRLE